MLFSILIANHNNGRFFKDCYNSIIAQTYTNWEAVIVEDGSTDDSVQVIKNIICNDNRFRFVENDKNYGCGYTKRRCAELAKGEVCGFLDPDDTIAANALEKMIQAHQHNDHALVYSNCYMCDENLVQHGLYPRSRQIDAQKNDFFNLEYAVLAFVSFKQSFYIKTAGIDPYMQRAVDQDLYLKLAETGSFYFIEDALYYYRMHHKGISVSNYDRSVFWHWVAIMQAAKRRNINVEELFLQNYVSKEKFAKLEKAVSKSRALKFANYWGTKLGPVKKLFRK
ncbi:MAG TPA: glycosyltransferase family 2 protein [Panacibacter sp.]|nr:glycosyltransferase family 2 protein [Panacibacter sp.]